MARRHGLMASTVCAVNALANTRIPSQGVPRIGGLQEQLLFAALIANRASLQLKTV